MRRPPPQILIISNTSLWTLPILLRKALKCLGHHGCKRWDTPAKRAGDMCREHLSALQRPPVMPEERRRGLETGSGAGGVPC